MKSMLRKVNDHGKQYECLAFICPGCIEGVGGTGLHLLPVNTTEKSPSWNWNGNLEKPTLNPSILTGKGTRNVCHSFLHDGQFQFLEDCTHPLAGQTVPMPDLPAWVVTEG